MRSLIVIAMFVVGLAHAGWGKYEEVRTLAVDSDDLTVLSVDAGAGSMDVTGIEGLDTISVKATIVVDEIDEDDALKFIEKRMTLSLQEKNGEVMLKSHLEHGFMGMGPNARINLDIRVPQGMAISIIDGAGSIDVNKTMGDVSIDDGSGGIRASDIEKNLIIVDDGSGGLSFSDVRGDVEQET